MSKGLALLVASSSLFVQSAKHVDLGLSYAAVRQNPYGEDDADVSPTTHLASLPIPTRTAPHTASQAGVRAWFPWPVFCHQSFAADGARVSHVLQLFRRRELWRLVTSSLCFTAPGEALFGLVLLYNFRVFERQRGSSKFGVRALPTPPRRRPPLGLWDRQL